MISVISFGFFLKICQGSIDEGNQIIQSTKSLTNRQFQVFVCLENSQCLAESLNCPGLDFDKICDGKALDCESGIDESKALCADQRWTNNFCKNGKIFIDQLILSAFAASSDLHPHGARKARSWRWHLTVTKMRTGPTVKIVKQDLHIYDIPKELCYLGGGQTLGRGQGTIGLGKGW